MPNSRSASVHDAIMRVFSRINLALAVLAAIVLFAVTMMIFVEVSWRFLGGRSQIWVTEVGEYSLLFITFLAAPYLLERKSHVTVDILLNSLSSGPARIVSAAVALLGLGICLLLAGLGVALVLDQYASGLRRVTVLAPQSWYITLVYPVGMGLMAVQFFDQALSAITKRSRPAAAEAE